MLLSDPRLRFARDLIAHWSHIRREGVVPFEEDLDPRALLPLRPFLTIVDVSRPDAAIVELAGAAVNRRYGRDLRKRDWLDFIAPEYRGAAVEAQRLLIAVPCGVYYRFAVSAGGVRVLEAETLSLPLRHRGLPAPVLTISLTRDILRQASGDAAARRTLDEVSSDFVDIGNGVPSCEARAGETRMRKHERSE